MILDEIEENPNCPSCDMMRFRQTGPTTKVTKIRLYHEDPAGKLYDVVGWNNSPDQPITDAVVQAVEDSGSGVAYLLVGGSWGLRFKKNDAPFSLDDPLQWGEPYLLLSDRTDTITG